MLMMMLALLSAAQTTGGDTPELNGQLFRPSIDGERTLWANDSAMKQTGQTTLRAALHYAHRPVVYIGRRGEKNNLVRGLWQTSIMAGHTRGPLRIGLDVPIYLRSTGDLGGETGLGDITPDLKLRLRDGSAGGLGMALAGRVALPTTTIEAPLGNRGLGYEIEGIADATVGRTLLVANLGLRGVPRANLENVVWDDALSARLAGSYALSDASGLSLELNGLLSVRNPGVSAALPAEALLGAYGRISDAFIVRGGAGTGITPGIGAPVFRGILAIGYEPTPKVRILDSDGDGLADDVDACPQAPEDIDAFRDTDGCPDATPVSIRIVDADGKPVEDATVLLAGERVTDTVELEPGERALAVRAPGYLPIERSETIPSGPDHEIVVQLLPAVPVGGVRVVATDADGKPVPGVAALYKAGTTERELSDLTGSDIPTGEGEVIVTAPGMRAVHAPAVITEGEVTEIAVTLEPAKVEISKDRIDIKDSVYFQTNKDVIKEASFDLLNEVAEILIDHPELAKVRVEGHTDSRGSASYNLDLSKRRAASVVRYLVDRGVPAERLESEGYGETKPLKAEETPEAWTLNRRVDFFVVERNDD